MKKSETIKQDNENTIVNVKPQNNINNVQQNIILNNLKNVEINQQIVNGIQNNIPALIQVDKQHPPPLIWRLPVDNKSNNTKISSATLTPITPMTTGKRFSHKKTEKVKTIDEPEKWDLDKLYNELSIVYDDKMKWGVIRVENKLSIIVFDNLIHPKKQMIVFYDLTYEV
ncbi:hypothetical protein HCN44_006612 [Aphidius gifuensis]|uniref:Uncharacterized protein n=1 Tax=Aphidius gifuensis TaxID=684658 RepID=A0A834XXU0_APHGI|nr:hypothetical protein HCN44_006612 [Aphidius gifuensis]